MDNGINVLSLFDGMSCGRIALERLGIKVNQYFASEIDKHAITVSKANYQDIIHIGDVTKVKACDLPPIQLVLAGSPCQGFSFAGKQLAFDDPRSALFFEFVRIWNEVKEINPDARFLLENVKMKKEHELVISRYMGVAPIEIDASLVSAQSRKRLFWTNIANRPYGLFGDVECTIPQPKDKGILLRDILDTDVPEKYYLSEKAINNLILHKERHKEAGHGFGAKFHDESHKMQALKVGGKGIDDLVIVASRGRNPENPGSREDGIELEQTLEPRLDGKTNLLIRIPEATKQGYVDVKPGDCFDLTMPDSETRRGKLMEDKSNCLTASKFDFMQYTEDHRIRRLTPTECEKLQTVPVGYTAHVSDSQRYKMLGNGWCIDVIVHILSYLDLPCKTK